VPKRAAVGDSCIKLADLEHAAELVGELDLARINGQALGRFADIASLTHDRGHTEQAQ
jgi:hypothetical protein